MSYIDYFLLDESFQLAFNYLKKKQNKINLIEIEHHAKIASMFISTRHNNDVEQFSKFIDGISYPKLEQIKKLDLYNNFLKIKDQK